MVKVSNTVQLVDQKQAAVWLDKRYKHQRKVSRPHVEHLAKAMADGTFSPVSIIMFSVLNGEMHLINGQQTLHAIVRSEKPQMLPVMFYEVSDESEEAKLYFHIDRQRRRGFEDSVRATGICETTNMMPSMIRNTARALRFIKGSFGAKRGYTDYVTDDELLEWLPWWEWEAKAIYNAITPCNHYDRSMVLSVPVFSVALVTMRYQPAKAREFWRQVAQDDRLERDDPRKVLRNWLISIKGQRTRTKSEVRLDESSRGCILAWNAYFAGKKLRSLRGIKTGPVKILGTSYSGLQGEDFLPIYPSPNLEQARLVEEETMSPVLPAANVT